MIVYSLISRGTTVLCEHTSNTGNFQQVTRTILDKFDEKCDGKHSYTYDNHLFHIMIQNNLIYLAMTTNDFERRIAFAFLEKIRADFESEFASSVATAVAYEMNKRFNKVLSEQMEYFSDSAKTDKVNALKGDIEDVKQVMAVNIERILDRGEKIELLVDRTADLQEQATRFKRSGAELKNRMWWGQFRLQILTVGSASAVLFIVIMASTKCFGGC
uniref:Uncharacterized protein n=1 Tax=Cryptomonas curvata TaxID=233186 RepID=A0A7S0M010_9CRYP